MKELKLLYPSLVDQDGTMNALTEYWEQDGTKLQNGMRVLVAEPNYRVDLESVTVLNLTLALTANRWCTVTKFEIVNGLVMFLGKYDDGTLVPRVYAPKIGWFVKRNSVPKSVSQREKVGKLVWDCLVWVEDGLPSDSNRERYAQEVIDEIMSIFGGTE